MSTRNAKAQEHLQHYVNRRELKHLGSQVTYALKHYQQRGVTSHFSTAQNLLRKLGQDRH